MHNEVKIRNASRIQRHIKEQKCRKDSGVLSWKHCQTGKFHASLTTVVFFNSSFEFPASIRNHCYCNPILEQFSKNTFPILCSNNYYSQHDSEKLKDG